MIIHKSVQTIGKCGRLAVVFYNIKNISAIRKLITRNKLREGFRIHMLMTYSLCLTVNKLPVNFYST